MVTLQRIFYHLTVIGGLVFFVIGCSMILSDSVAQGGDSKTTLNQPSKEYPLSNGLAELLFPGVKEEVPKILIFNKRTENKCNLTTLPEENFKFPCNVNNNQVNTVYLGKFGIGNLDNKTIDAKTLGTQNLSLPIYLSSGGPDSQTATLSVPIKGYLGKEVCLLISPAGKKVCTEKKITVAELMQAKQNVGVDLIMPGETTGEPNPPTGATPTETPDTREECSTSPTSPTNNPPVNQENQQSSTEKKRGNEKLIVVALSKKFDINKTATTLKETLKELVKDMHQKFTLVVIDSGRERTVISSPNQIERTVISLPKQIDGISFAAEDLKAADDLELIDDLVTDKVGKVLYLTGNDGLSEKIPRNQCMALAWEHDGVQLQVITQEENDCRVWQSMGKCQSLSKVLKEQNSTDKKRKLLRIFFKNF